MARFGLTVREGARVSRVRSESIDELFLAVELHAEQLSGNASSTARPVNALTKTFEPIEQVHGRIEISESQGLLRPRRRGGIDVRGDGSMEAYLGRTTRSVVEQQPGESVVSALRRAFTAKG